VTGRTKPPGPSGWLVEYHSQAVEEYQALRDAKQRKGILTIVDILRQLGPKITEPHMKPVAGTGKLRELRPGGGKTLVRPLYFRFDDRTFKVVAIAPEAQVDRSGFESAVQRAVARAERDYGVSL
jgi:hypothetical protein